MAQICIYKDIVHGNGRIVIVTSGTCLLAIITLNNLGLTCWYPGTSNLFDQRDEKYC